MKDIPSNTYNIAASPRRRELYEKPSDIPSNTYNIAASPRRRELYEKPSDPQPRARHRRPVDECAGMPDEWPFPSVHYDYEAARVGTGYQVIEIDHEEVARVLALFRSAPQ